MSLRSKIILLFLGLSVLPVLVLAIFIHAQIATLAFQVAGPEGAEAVMGPVWRLHRSYWLFVIALGASTTVAFSLSLGRVTRSLNDLIRAAEQIGEGDLNPWLPPPADDEVGRLTLALSGMLERIRSMVDRVDQSGRLAALGQLSSYLAHEIRTPLSSTRMNLQRLQRWVRAGRLPEECAEPIEISLEEIDRLATSVSGVLALARPQDTPRVALGVHDVVEEAAELLRGEMERRGVDLVLDLDAEADRVLARPGQLKGVFLNLMLNALEAQPEGGRIEIVSRLVVSSPGAPPSLELRVRDQGPGVPSGLRARIFDPFFTTKDSGSGIGLAVASQSVRDNGGELLLEPPAVADRGAEFLVRLPLAPVAADEGTDTSLMERAAIFWRGPRALAPRDPAPPIPTAADPEEGVRPRLPSLSKEKVG